MGVKDENKSVSVLNDSYARGRWAVIARGPWAPPNPRWSRRPPLRFSQIALPAGAAVSQVGLARGGRWARFSLAVGLFPFSRMALEYTRSGEKENAALDGRPDEW
jgi:hypothetical protein